MTLEQKLTLALAHRGMTEAAVARAIGMSCATFHDKLKNASFTVSELERIAGALGARYAAEFDFGDGKTV